MPPKPRIVDTPDPISHGRCAMREKESSAHVGIVLGIHMGLPEIRVPI